MADPISEDNPVPELLTNITAMSAGASYTPRAWYWLVANRTDSPVYSSALAAYLPEDDSTYTAWLAEGNNASAILCDGELADVLTKAGLEGAVVLNTTPTEWGACQPADITAAMQAAGVKLTSAAKPALDAHYQLSGPFDAMGRTATYVNAYGQLPNNQPLTWPAYDKSVTLDTAADFNEVYQGLQDYYNAWQSGVAAGGTLPEWGTKSIA
jgi:hypothetical protein